MASKGFDYSKWDNIEISDDEADCHPNIDKASWFRMKHRSRVEREDQDEGTLKTMETENAADSRRLEEITALLKEIEEGGDAAEYEDPDALAAESAELTAKMKARTEKKDFMEGPGKKWNVDNMCHVAAERTIVSGKGEADDGLTINKGPTMLEPSRKDKSAPATAGPAAPSDRDQTHAAVQGYSDFVETNEALLEEYVEIQDLEKLKNFLHEKGGILLDDHSQSYLLLSCLEDEMNGKHARMLVGARNSQVLSHITELAQSLQRHPRDVVLPFFARISIDEYLAGFNDAVKGFQERIEKRAIEKRKEMDAEAAAEGEEVELSREERLGPGGLDPVEVFETLPVSMQEAFESKDVGALQEALKALPIDEVKYHMKRCEDSGLWVAGGGVGGGGGDDDDDDDEAAKKAAALAEEAAAVLD